MLNKSSPDTNAEWSLWFRNIQLALFVFLIESSSFQQAGVSMGIWRFLSALNLVAIQRSASSS